MTTTTWENIKEWGEVYLRCPECKSQFKIIDVLGKATEINKIQMNYCPVCGSHLKNSKN